MSIPNWNWRPDSLEAFVGQTEFKKWLRLEIPAAVVQNRPLGNMLLVGPAGLGKTSMSYCLARARGVNAITLMGPSVDINVIGRVFGAMPNVPDHEQVSDVGWGRREYTEPGTGRRLCSFYPTGEPTLPSIVILDEADAIEASVWETIHKLMEPDADGHRMFFAKPQGSSVPWKFWVPPFTMVALTNHPDLIPAAAKRSGRCRFIYEFKPYTVAEITEVIRQFSGAVGVKIADDAMNEIAERSNGLPAAAKDYFIDARSALDMLRLEQQSQQDVIDLDVLKMAFEASGIDRMGLREDHRTYLRLLNESTSGTVPLPTVAAMLNKSTRAISSDVEPVLIRRGLISVIAKGRQITPAGRAHITPAGEHTTTGHRLKRSYPQ